MASGGSARPAPAARRTIPPTRSGSRHARRRSAVIIPIRPSTATWLPVSARRAALDPPSSPTSERRKANGHAGGSWRAGGVRVSAPTTERTARARAASTITKRAARREDGVGPRVSAPVAPGGAEQEGKREEPAGPHTRGEQVNAVRGDRERRGRLHGGRVARGRDRNEGGRAEQHGLAPRRSPVHASLHVEAQREKRREQHEDAVADEPDVTRLGLEEHPRDRGR